MEPKNRGGRPPKYDLENVAEAIKILRASRIEITPVSVKNLMVERFGASTGINIQSLEKEINRTISAESEAMQRNLVQLLPEAIKTSIHDGLMHLEAGILVTLGEQFGVLRHASLIDVEKAERDKARLHESLEEKDAKISAMTHDLDELGQHNGRLGEELNAVNAELANANMKVEKLEARVSGYEQMFELFKKFFPLEGAALLNETRRETDIDPQKG